MMHMDLLTKHMMSSGSKTMNAPSLSGGKCNEDEMFEALYNKEVQFLSNQSRGSHPTYQKKNGYSRFEE
ncbi:hypothetical protein MTR67_017986 [Solanum verrucosum]|uniref:Uncharacterized protein n=1 Tax=Solanum verrucosum TaxID=315347 RepID=A0AAF0QJV3_SOLVR|nr:hypothetical protein MTR67_017986 [Solanum verrucosum]